MIEMQIESVLTGQQIQTSQQEETVAVDSSCWRGWLDSKAIFCLRDQRAYLRCSQEPQVWVQMVKHIVEPDDS